MKHKAVPLVQVQISRIGIRAVQKVLKSGQLRAGALVEKFEADFARVVGARHAIAVNSGTSALYMACRLLLRPGDEVIVPDFTFVATASMVLAAGARPVLADVHPHTFNLDPQDVERRITPRTRAILPVHLYGQPAEVAAISGIARRHRLHLIWDAAQAHGALYEGQDVGSFPDLVCYSFYPSKNMTTGEGGMITTSSGAAARELRLLRSHGEDRRYHHVRLGFNFRMTDIAAAIGIEQLRKLPASVRRRRRNAFLLFKGLAGIPGLQIPGEASGAFHAYNCYTIRVDPVLLGITRDKLQERLARSGVQTAVHYPLPLHRQPLFRGYGQDSDFPTSTSLAKTVLSLPVHPGLSQNDLEWIIRSVRKVVEG